MNSNNTSSNNLAITAEVLYLVNLLLLPGIAFLLLWILHHEQAADNPSSLVRCHLQQCFRASLLAGFFIIIVSALIMISGGFNQALTWVVLIIYFTCIHSALILLGVLGLARAMAGRHFHYPLTGVRCHDA